MIAGDIKQVKSIINENPSLVNTKDKFGLISLHKASERGRKEVAEFLISKGANVNARDNDSRTPLRSARNSEVEEVLRKYGGYE